MAAPDIGCIDMPIAIEEKAYEAKQWQSMAKDLSKRPYMHHIVIAMLVNTCMDLKKQLVLIEERINKLEGK